MREGAYGEPRTDPVPQPMENVRTPAEPAPVDTGQVDTGPVDRTPEPVDGPVDRAPEPMGGPVDGTVDGTVEGAREPGDAGAVLFGGAGAERFREQWRELQAEFVDDPMTAVQGADRLVDEVLRALSESFAAHKHELESQWQGGGTGETEELRQAMRRYRSFLDQLLDA